MHSRCIQRFATPRQIDFIDALPREPTGKLFKRLLRDRYRSEASSS